MPFRLIHVQGGIEPFLVPATAKDEDELERMLLEYMITSKDYDDETDLFFSVEVDDQGRLREVSSFSGGFMDEMRRRAKSPKEWSPRRPGRR